MKKVIFLLLVLLVISIAGCGGGGGDDSGPVASTETFQLKTAFIASITSSSSSTFTLSGTSSGKPVTGSGTIVESSLTPATFEGVNCFKQVTTLTGTVSANGNTIPLGSTGTYFYDGNSNYLGYSGGSYSVVVGTMTIPVTAKVNDTGILFTEQEYSSSLKSVLLGTNTVSFSIEPDTATTALLKIIETEKDTLNTVVSTDIIVYRITPSGTLTKIYETYVDDVDNLRIDF